jgi:hypothetical protein
MRCGIVSLDAFQATTYSGTQLGALRKALVGHHPSSDAAEVGADILVVGCCNRRQSDTTAAEQV